MFTVGEDTNERNPGFDSLRSNLVIKQSYMKMLYWHYKCNLSCFLKTNFQPLCLMLTLFSNRLKARILVFGRILAYAEFKEG